MSFGNHGILGRARRGNLTWGQTSSPFGPAPFGPIVRDGVLVPRIYFPAERATDADVLDPVLAHNHPEALCTDDRLGAHVMRQRTLISDSRDLLAETLYELTSRNENGPIRRDQTPASWILSRATSQGPGERAIHLGRTTTTDQLLERLASGGFLDSAWGWDGDFDHLDADGFVVISLRDRDDRHLIFGGGSEYAVYFAVAWFLQQHAHVSWCYPGEDGTVIPRGSPSFSVDLVNRIEEPDYRGRTLAAMADTSIGGVHTPREINEVRNWLLRNRLRPSTERIALFYNTIVPPLATSNEGASFRNCSTLPDRRRALLRLEDRIPTGHNLSRAFSPHQPSMAPGAMSRNRIDEALEMYPDPRPRPGPVTEWFRFPSGDRPALQEQLDLPRSESPLPNAASPCPAIIEQRTSSDRPTVLVENDPTRPEIGVPRIFSTARRRTRFLRHVPRTLLRTHTQVLSPTGPWGPCLYTPVGGDSPSTDWFRLYPVGRRAPFRRTVATDLAAQLASASHNRHLLDRIEGAEFCESLAPDDTITWCKCTACTLSNEVDDSGTPALLFQGHVLVRDYGAIFDARPSDNHWHDHDDVILEARGVRIFEALRSIATDFANSRSQSPNWNVVRSGISQQLGLDFFAAETGTVGPARRLTSTQLDALDRAALQGVINDRARLNTYTRRVIDLMNATARALMNYEDTGLPPPAEHTTLLTFHSYSDYTAPPIFEHDPMEPRRYHFYSPLGLFPPRTRPCSAAPDPHPHAVVHARCLGVRRCS